MADAEMTAASQRWAEQFNTTACCPECKGARLNREALSYKFGDKNIAELAAMDVAELKEWLDGIGENLSGKQQAIATEILKKFARAFRSSSMWDSTTSRSTARR